MKIGAIGAGNIGATLARKLAASGDEVRLAKFEGAGRHSSPLGPGEQRAQSAVYIVYERTPMKPRQLLPLSILLFLALGGGSVRALTAEDVNKATMGGVVRKNAIKPDPSIVKAQVLLSRRGISPGVIDGLDGQNYRKAIAQFRRQEMLGESDGMDERVWLALGGNVAGDIVAEYKVTGKDASYDFARRIPRNYAKQAAMKRLSYTSPPEMFAERFQMSEGLLKALNPRATYRRPGESLFVVSVKRAAPGEAQRVEAVKGTGRVVVYGQGDQILASYPATIGSSQTPSPDGEHQIERVARNPKYHYDPDKNFRQGNNNRKLVLPAGPNSPVGTVWIALSKPTFGIHGTPEPSRVGKASSHGCVRLTNWDAEELAEMVKPGVPVRFVD